MTPTTETCGVVSAGFVCGLAAHHPEPFHKDTVIPGGVSWRRRPTAHPFEAQGRAPTSCLECGERKDEHR